MRRFKAKLIDIKAKTLFQVANKNSDRIQAQVRILPIRRKAAPVRAVLQWMRLHRNTISKLEYGPP